MVKTFSFYQVNTSATSPASRWMPPYSRIKYTKKGNMKRILFAVAETGLLVIQYTDPFCAEIHFVGIIAAHNDQFPGTVIVNEGVVEFVTGFV